MYFTYTQPIIYAFFLHFCFSKKSAENTIAGVLIILLFLAKFINIVINPISTAQFSFFWQHQI